jgi:hypothetical protein
MSGKIRSVLWLPVAAVGLGAFAPSSHAGPAVGNPEHVVAVFKPVIEGARLVCIDDPARSCDIDFTNVGDVSTLVESRHVVCKSPACQRPCPAGPADQKCRPAFLSTNSTPDAIVALRGEMRVTTTQIDDARDPENPDDDERSLEIEVEVDFGPDRNPGLTSNESIRQVFSRNEFLISRVTCFGEFTAPGVVIQRNGWFPAGADSCVFEEPRCPAGGAGVDFAGMLIPIQEARSELVRIARSAFPGELDGFEPIPLAIDVVRSNGKLGGAITGTPPLCVTPNAPPSLSEENGTRVRSADYDVVVRFAEPKTGGPAPRLCDVDGDGGVDQADIQAILAAGGTSVEEGDPRDSADPLGVIDVLDSRTCVLLCDQPHCGQ